jgi:D-serine deaminase-like pyridoxal phosphate-dependent protein
VSALRETSRRLRALGLTRATLLVDERRARANIRRFRDRADAAGVLLRPHFKTHQSAAVGAWFRDEGIDRATVSSLGQAAYFAEHGWRDLTLAVGANPLEAAEYDALAADVRLGLLTDSEAAVTALAAALTRPVRLWLDVDVGDGRTGVPWQDTVRLGALIRCAAASPALEIAGLLTHAGHAYGASGPAAAAAVFRESLHRLRACREALAGTVPGPLALSAGDTPGFSAVRDWSGLDEARPGNFVFYDLMQLEAGACTPDDLACAVAAPVIGVYPDAGRVVLHAGAVHLSREVLAGPAGPCFGRLLSLDDGGFGGILPGWSLASLSQEHGVLEGRDATAREGLADLEPGDLLLLAPVHSCLTCEQFQSYRGLDGAVLERYRRP